MIGFHGCDAETAFAVITGETTLRPSTNKYDWLGHGIYFWEGSPSRARHFAEEVHQGKIKSARPIRTPAVVGSVFDLGNCLDLSDYNYLKLVKEAYDSLVKVAMKLGLKLPVNHTINQSHDVLLRVLDCTVIEFLHQYNKAIGIKAFDSIRSPFEEGDHLYPLSGFKEKSHIQICIRNPECIIGYFKPLSEAPVRMPIY